MIGKQKIAREVYFALCVNVLRDVVLCVMLSFVYHAFRSDEDTDLWSWKCVALALLL